jgi:hypothetical protein
VGKYELSVEGQVIRVTKCEVARDSNGVTLIQRESLIYQRTGKWRNVIVGVTNMDEAIRVFEGKVAQGL